MRRLRYQTVAWLTLMLAYGFRTQNYKAAGALIAVASVLIMIFGGMWTDYTKGGDRLP